MDVDESIQLNLPDLLTPPADHYRDIKVYPDKRLTGPFYISSLQGERAVADVFELLDLVVGFLGGAPHTFILRKVINGTPSSIIERDSISNLLPGEYMIESVPPGLQAYKFIVASFADAKDEMALPNAAESPLYSTTKRAPSGSVVSSASKRDSTSASFKLRLVSRDKSCVICHAQGVDQRYRNDDSSFYQGSQIFPFALTKLWTLRGYSGIVKDPFTSKHPTNATRNKNDPIRINSLENGLLLCLFHHKCFDVFRLSIHPESHKIYAFHPSVASLHGQEVTRPWTDTSPGFPAPHPDILREHFMTAVMSSMKAAAEPEEEEEEEEDSFELGEMVSIRNDNVRIWAEGIEEPLESLTVDDELDKVAITTSNGLGVDTHHFSAILV